MDSKRDIEKEVEEYQHKQRDALEKLVKSGKLTDIQAEECNRLFTRFYRQKLSVGIELDWKKIKPLPEKDVLNIDESNESRFTDEEIVSFLKKLVVLKLNGGLGTSMGCDFPKSCIKVKDNLTFLHIILKQIHSINEKYHIDLPLVFMNSGRTEKMTKEVVDSALKELGFKVNVHFFNQPVFPRADVDTLLPTKAVKDDNPEYWYPPGHASVLDSFEESGLAEEFLECGKEWVFISNSDNLGGTPDGNILGSIIKKWETEKTKGGEEYSFFMEATHKTSLDVKGGTPILYDGRPFLLEASQVPKGKEEEIFDIKKFTLFNSGNLWINLRTWIKQDSFDLPIIYNPKVIKGDNGSAKVVQLEMCAGAALSQFNSVIMSVPRSRFIPVKLTCDLIRLQSDLYTFHDDGTVEPNLEKLPTIVLSKEFTRIRDYAQRINGSVSLKDAKRVVLDGNIELYDVCFKGDVEIHNNNDSVLKLTGVVQGE